MALLINRPIAEGFPEHEFYVRVHCASVAKTRLAPRPNPQAMADEAYAEKIKAGLTPEDIANRPSEFNGQPTRWTSDGERLKDAAAVAADRAKRVGEEAVRSAGERDVRSSARIEFYRSRADADAGRMPFDVTFAAFDLDLSEGALNPLAQAYEAAKRRYPNARDDNQAVPEPEEVEIAPQEAATIIDGFVGVLRTGREVAEDTMRSLISADRKKLFSILNGELGNLKNEEALLGKSIPRRADVESLLGILARVGEAYG